MLSGVPCPNYIKSVKIFNHTNELFEVNSKFESGKSTHTVISPGEKKLIEELKHEGSASYVDPIVSMDGHRAGQPHKPILHLKGSDAHCIEKRYYEITPNFMAVQGQEPAEI